jgi:ketosteroid isomerase-like protein
MTERPEQLHRAFQDAFNRHDLESINLRTLGVNVSGSLAMLHGKWTLTETGPDGCEIRRVGRNTETARQQSDGRWLFVIDNPAVPQD